MVVRAAGIVHLSSAASVDIYGQRDHFWVYPHAPLPLQYYGQAGNGQVCVTLHIHVRLGAADASTKKEQEFFIS